MTTDPRVEAYLAEQPADHRAALNHLRTVVRRAVPHATETISYALPTFQVNGKLLVSYAGWKEHCSLYPLTGSFLEQHASAIEGFDRTKGSVHFTPEHPLPDETLEYLVLARLADLEAGRR